MADASIATAGKGGGLTGFRFAMTLGYELRSCVSDLADSSVVGQCVLVEHSRYGMSAACVNRFFSFRLKEPVTNLNVDVI